MLKNKTTLLTTVFWLLTFLDVFAVGYPIPGIHFLAKPLLMPALILLLLNNKNGTTTKWWLLTGLFFSFLGDVFLLFEFKNALFFMLGLAAFLLTHICYIIYFIKIKSPQVSLLSEQPWLAALVIAYGCGLVLLLYPSLGALKIPVMLYAAVICCMLVCSLHVFYKVGRPANVYFVVGAVLFVVSDSLLAINKFLTPFPMAGVLIMLTYCAAQFSIVKGYLK